jgi:hypothetical protein
MRYELQKELGAMRTGESTPMNRDVEVIIDGSKSS